MKNTARFLSLLKSLFFLFLGVVFCDVDLSVRFGADFTYGNFAKRINGSVLQKNDSLLSRLEVEDDIECAEKCVLNQLCLSVNFESKPSKILCELMSWGGTDYRDFLIKKEGFFHVRMMTVCSSNPCERVNMTCIPNMGKPANPYTCACKNNMQSYQACLSGSQDCNALGIKDGTILNSQMTASSEYSSTYAAHTARLGQGSSWVPKHGDTNLWVQVNFATLTTIVGFASQGRYGYASLYFKAYQLSYLLSDGVTWELYSEGGQEK
ncbi:hypothetical protein QZH41_008165, partial [Actinostola sp. cb2023]